LIIGIKRGKISIPQEGAKDEVKGREGTEGDHG
jgi:hypothetical protein